MSAAIPRETARVIVLSGDKHMELSIRGDHAVDRQKVTPEGLDFADLRLGRQIMDFVVENSPSRRAQKVEQS